MAMLKIKKGDTVRVIAGKDKEKKISLLLDYTDHPRDVADPWYTGDFETAYQDILAGCRGLLAALTAQGGPR